MAISIPKFPSDFELSSHEILARKIPTENIPSIKSVFFHTDLFTLYFNANLRFIC